MKKIIFVFLILLLPCLANALPNATQMEWFQSTLNTGSPYDSLRQKVIVDSIILNAVLEVDSTLQDSLGTTNAILRTVRDTLNENTATLRDSLAEVISELRTMNDNVYGTAISDTLNFGTVARQLISDIDCDVTIQNITNGATVYVGDASGQYIILLYLDTFRTGEVANSNIYYVRSSQANTDIAIIGRQK